MCGRSYCSQDDDFDTVFNDIDIDMDDLEDDVVTLHEIIENVSNIVLCNSDPMVRITIEHFACFFVLGANNDRLYTFKRT